MSKDKSNARTEFLHIRVTPAQKKLIVSKSEKENITITKLITDKFK